MVPDKFNMVDMEGIDLIESQGVPIPGLYQKLVESIAQCRYTVLYNWQFNKILIPPTPVELMVENQEVKINEDISVTSNDIIVISSVEPPPVLPVIQSLSVTENGIYIVPEGVDGYNPVSVTVPSEEPLLQVLSVTENGNYLPDTGYDGFSSVSVNVPQVRAPKLFWDLSESLTDEIEGAQATLLGGAVMEEDGVSLPRLNSYINLPDWLVNSRLLSIEVSFGEMSAQATNLNLRLIAFGGSSGFAYRGDVGVWGFYSGSAWSANSDISDINYFSNSVLRVYILADGRWNVYKDNVLVYTTSVSQPVNLNRLSVASGSTGFYPAKVKTIKIF